MVTRLVISYAVNAPDDPPEVVADVVARVLVHGGLSLLTPDPLDSEGATR